MINSQVQRKTCSFWNPKSMSNIILQGLEKIVKSDSINSAGLKNTGISIAQDQRQKTKVQKKNMQFLDFEK
jgi:hypothetical protein